MLETAAAGNLHTDDGDAFNIVVCDNLRQLFGVIAVIQLRTANQRNPAPDKVLVESSIGIGGTVCGYQQVCTVKIRSVYRDKLNLYRLL